MTQEDRWLLPEGIEEVLPTAADRLERLRRRLLDLYRAWGYELFIPPFIEYLESLLTGTGNDLDLQTFKLTDQLTGRMMGVRADMTPQAARIDAHSLKRNGPVRLCYMGTVLHTRPEAIGGTRSPLQVGAELFGHAGIESDVEIMCLMLETLAVTGLNEVHVDLGHVGIFRGLAREAGLDAVQEGVLFDALQRKARPEIEVYLSGINLDAARRDRLTALVDLNGGSEVLAAARTQLKGAGPDVQAALDNLERIVEAAQNRLPSVTLYFDLAELRGYGYHTGVVFGAFVPGCGQAVAQGGRYDDVGRVFGRARPATGFSADLKVLLGLLPEEPAPANGICAPWSDDRELCAAIATLRGEGERVIVALPGQADGPADMGCDRMLEKRNGAWIVRGLASD